MKKIFTFISLFVLALGAQAQTIYNFSDETAWGANRTITENFTYGPITLKAGAATESDKNTESWVLDDNNKTIEGIKCTRRWKSGGATNTNGTRSIAITVSKNTVISFGAASSSSSETRTVFIATEPGSDPEASTVLQSFSALSAAAYSYTYTGNDATLYICCAGGINFYYIKTEPYVDPSEAESKTWDFSVYEDKVSLHGDGTTAKSIEYDGLTLLGIKDVEPAAGPKDYVSAATGFHANGASNSTRRYIMYKPIADGTLKVTFKSNTAGATDRITAIGTEVSTFTDITAAPATVLKCAYTADPNVAIEANVVAGTTYYMFFPNGGQSITKVEYTPAGSTNVKSVKAAAVKTGVTYNLAGQQVGDDYKGIVVKDGVKVVQ